MSDEAAKPDVEAVAESTTRGIIRGLLPYLPAILGFLGLGGIGGYSHYVADNAKVAAVADATSGTNWIGVELWRANSNLWSNYFAQQTVNSNLQAEIDQLKCPKP